MKRLYLFLQRNPWVSPLPARDGEDVGDEADGACPWLDSSPPSMLLCPLQRGLEAIPPYSLPRKAEKNKSQLVKFLGPFLIRGLCTLLEPGGFLRAGPGSLSHGARVKSMASAIRSSVGASTVRLSGFKFGSALMSWVV